MNLGKGSACAQCRGQKLKCDGVKPECSRCLRLQKECAYFSSRATRRPVADLMQARILRLQLEVNKLMLSSKHELLITSTRLRERIMDLGDPKTKIPTHSDTSLLSIYLWYKDREPVDRQPMESGGLEGVIERRAVELHLKSFQWSIGEEVPLPMSRYLICLFLPHRFQNYFNMDLPYFLQCLSLPPSHPKAIHPCLLNACYLAACNIIGGPLAQLEPYFLERSRFFLNQALMLADRIPHFLWASTLLGYYLAKNRRLEESFITVSAACRLMTACGLRTSVPPTVLLPPPANKAEGNDRIRLFDSLYMEDQWLSALFSFPTTLAYDEQSEEWEPTSDEASPTPSKTSKADKEQESSSIWRSNVHLRASVMQIFQQVHKLALTVSANGYFGHEDTYESLSAQVQCQNAKILSLSEKQAFNPHLLLTHVTLLGSALILYSLRARDDVKAKDEMLSFATALVRICQELQKHQHLHSVQCSLSSMLHLMNAARIFGRELLGYEARENNRISTEYCYSIEYLLDIMDAVTARYPAWADAPKSIKATLTTALDTIVP
ncbi:hypothetical protein DL93DRAFT_1689534 [Clavulina sp. PMI_390]|nr:hypothetical protein DL93DRAFT_1689534 [Clavulina sp. PMI_390]